MSFTIPIEKAQKEFPKFKFISALTPSAQKAAFHVVEDKNGNNLCLKIISPAYSVDERFQREVQFLRTIDHPNIVKFIEYTFTSSPHEHRHYVIEEFVEGEDLTERFRTGNPWLRSDASCFFAQIGDGLLECKKKSVVHRDLKPSNIRVRPNGIPVIIDFGLARHLNLPDLTNTEQGAAIGTQTYFAPEQWVGNKYDIDHRTDLFAFGILLYQALIGCHPFYQPNMTRHELCEATCNSNDHFNKLRVNSLPNEWKLILKRLLNKNKSERPHNAGMVANILRKISDI